MTETSAAGNSDTVPERSPSADERPIEELLRAENIENLLHQTKARGDAVALLGPGARIADALDLLRLPGSRGAVLVIDGRRLVGIFTERDYLDKVAGEDIGHDTPVERFMTSSPETLSAGESVSDAIHKMTQGGYRHLPVLSNEGEVLGVVSTRDLIADMAEHFPVEVLNLPPRVDQDRAFTTREGG